MVIQEKDQVQLKIVKQQYRGSVKRASDMKMKVELYRVSICPSLYFGFSLTFKSKMVFTFFVIDFISEYSWSDTFWTLTIGEDLLTIGFISV